MIILSSLAKIFSLFSLGTFKQFQNNFVSSPDTPFEPTKMPQLLSFPYTFQYSSLFCIKPLEVHHLCIHNLKLLIYKLSNFIF